MCTGLQPILVECWQTTTTTIAGASSPICGVLPSVQRPGDCAPPVAPHRLVAGSVLPAEYWVLGQIQVRTSTSISKAHPGPFTHWQAPPIYTSKRVKGPIGDQAAASAGRTSNLSWLASMKDTAAAASVVPHPLYRCGIGLDCKSSYAFQIQLMH